MSIRVWNIIHAFLILSGMTLSVLLNRLIILDAIALFSFMFFIAINHHHLKQIKPYAGYANRITLARLLGMMTAGYFSFHIREFWFFVIMLLLVITDGLDGYLARRNKTVSKFGQYFDMETDAFYVALMSVILVLKGKIGEWFLLVGALRYLFVLTVYLLGWQNREEKRTRLGPAIGVFLFLAVLSPFVLPAGICFPLLILAAGAVILSFSYSFYLIAFRKS